MVAGMSVGGCVMQKAGLGSYHSVKKTKRLWENDNKTKENLGERHLGEIRT